MKRLLIVVLVLIIAHPVYAQEKDQLRGRSSVAALKTIDGSTLRSGMFAFVANDPLYGDVVLWYAAVESGTIEELPDVVSPNTGAGDWRWHRLKTYAPVGDIEIMATGTDPVVTEDYQISHDTDGANLAGDRIIRAQDASGNQWPVGRKLQPYTIPFAKIQSMDTATRDKYEVFPNYTGMDFNITQIVCTSDIATSISFKTTTSISNSAISTTIGTISVNVARTSGGYYTNTLAASLASPLIASGKMLVMDFHDTDNVGSGQCTIIGWHDAEVD